jgi:EpsI family protein
MANTFRLKTGLFLAGMVGAIAASVALTPKSMHAAGEAPPVRLESIIPRQFGDWVIDESAPIQVVSPALQAKLNEFYSATLTRNYVNRDGYRIMLSLAYGADQSRSLQVHKPEHCYSAYGYKLSDQYKDNVRTSVGQVPVMRLVAQKDTRIEPITYWIKFGDYLIRGWYEQNLARVKSGLKGHLPDGLLVRVSSVDADSQQAYAAQTSFINAMLGSITPEGQKFLLGANFMTNASSTP